MGLPSISNSARGTEKLLLNTQVSDDLHNEVNQLVYLNHVLHYNYKTTYIANSKFTLILNSFTEYIISRRLKSRNHGLVKGKVKSDTFITSNHLVGNQYIGRT